MYRVGKRLGVKSSTIQTGCGTIQTAKHSFMDKIKQQVNSTVWTSCNNKYTCEVTIHSSYSKDWGVRDTVVELMGIEIELKNEHFNCNINGSWVRKTNLHGVSWEWMDTLSCKV